MPVNADYNVPSLPWTTITPRRPLGQAFVTMLPETRAHPWESENDIAGRELRLFCRKVECSNSQAVMYIARIRND